ncbi:MAG TPA: sugar phosphate isomerase/epimerase family protein [Candidatus Baltobacteraceae bacterium]|nr:sugar phosphate isomerase/epimerase family protein [Candidatus Baltobacteraceae bacterium]
MSAPAFGFSEFTTWPWTYARDLQRYGRHGASVIEVCLFKQAQGEFGALAEIEKHGLRASSIQMNVHSVFVDSMANKPEDPADRVAEMKETIAACAPFLPRGTPFIVITGIPPQKNIRKAVERTVEALKELGEAAGRAGMRIAFEPLSPVNIHTDTAVWGLDQGLDVIERVADPNVGICIDSWNVWQTPQLEDVIRRCGDRIFVVQLSDWQTPRSTADRYTLGTGEIDLRAMIRAIRATGYDGPWVVEILSSMHLDGSLWKRDLDRVLEENRAAFDRIWAQSSP